MQTKVEDLSNKLLVNGDTVYLDHSILELTEILVEAGAGHIGSRAGKGDK